MADPVANDPLSPRTQTNGDGAGDGRPIQLEIEEGSAAAVLGQTWADAVASFRALTPQELALNAGLSALTVVIAAALVWAAGRLLKRTPDPDVPVETDRAGRPKKPKPPASLMLVRVLVVLGALWALLAIWGLDPMRLVTGDAGGAILRVVISIGLVVFALDAIPAFVERTLAGLGRKSADPNRGRQLSSIAPLASALLRTVVLIVGALLIVSQLGVRLGPLLAGAGVLSVAIAIGAQTLFKDYMTGFSLIFEDIVAVGDTVRIKDSQGRIEAMTLRTLRLRGFDGTMHVVPYSEAQIIHNLTKTFSRRVIDVTVVHETDVERALDVMREAAGAVGANRDLFLEPPEVHGLQRLAEIGLVLRARVKSPPARQWDAARAFNQELKARFDAAGIELAKASVALERGPEEAAEQAP